MKNEFFGSAASPLYKKVISPLSHFISLKSTRVVSNLTEAPVKIHDKNCAKLNEYVIK